MPQMSPMNWLALFMFFSACSGAYAVKVSSLWTISLMQDKMVDIKLQKFNMLI